MALAHELWPARATVLDLGNLDYQWGDWIGAAFRGDPFARVVSDRCRAGLTSYVQAEMGKNPSDFPFDSIPEAITRLCSSIGTIELSPRRVPERSARTISTQAVPLGPEEHDRALLLGITGTWQSSDAGFVMGHALATLAAWEFTALVFDFRELRFGGGSEMKVVLILGKRDSPERELHLQVFGKAGDDGYPGKELTCVLVSASSREGIASCLDGLGEIPSRWLFDDLEVAVRSLRSRDRSGPGFLPIE